MVNAAKDNGMQSSSVRLGAHYRCEPNYSFSAPDTDAKMSRRACLAVWATVAFAGWGLIGLAAQVL